MADTSPAIRRAILFLFWAQVGVFAFILLTMFAPALRDIIPDAILWGAGLLFAFGAGLTALVVRAQLDRPLKRLLLLTGVSAIAMVLCFLLHNAMYALNTLAAELPIISALLSVLEAAFFLAAIFVFPVTFVIGTVGVIVLLVRAGTTPHHPSEGGLSPSR